MDKKFTARMYYLSFFDDSDTTILQNEFVTPAVSATFPGAAKHAMSRGVIAEEAMRIECPVFLGFGERDTSQDPKAEPSGYLRSNDIALAIIPGMAHGQNFEFEARRALDPHPPLGHVGGRTGPFMSVPVRSGNVEP